MNTKFMPEFGTDIAISLNGKITLKEFKNEYCVHWVLKGGGSITDYMPDYRQAVNLLDRLSMGQWKKL